MQNSHGGNPLPYTGPSTIHANASSMYLATCFFFFFRQTVSASTIGMSQSKLFSKQTHKTGQAGQVAHETGAAVQSISKLAISNSGKRSNFTSSGPHHDTSIMRVLAMVRSMLPWSCVLWLSILGSSVLGSSRRGVARVPTVLPCDHCHAKCHTHRQLYCCGCALWACGCGCGCAFVVVIVCL